MHDGPLTSLRRLHIPAAAELPEPRWCCGDAGPLTATLEVAATQPDAWRVRHGDTDAWLMSLTVDVRPDATVDDSTWSWLVVDVDDPHDRYHEGAGAPTGPVGGQWRQLAGRYLDQLPDAWARRRRLAERGGLGISARDLELRLAVLDLPPGARLAANRILPSWTGTGAQLRQVAEAVTRGT